MNLLLSPQNFENEIRVDKGHSLRKTGQFVLTVLLTLPFSTFALALQNQLPLWPATLSPVHPLTWFYFVTVLPFSIYLSVAVHESGHALIAKLLGYRIVMLTVGMIGIAYEKNGLRLRRVGTDLLALRGSTIALTTRPKYHRMREMGVLAGGVVAQLILLWLLILLSGLNFPLISHPWFTAFVHSLSLITFAGLCGSVVPIKVGQTETDAFQMVQLLRGGKNVQRRLLLQRMTAQCLAGSAYANLNAKEIQRVLKDKDGSRQEYAANLLAYLHAIGNQQAEDALLALNQVLQYVDKNPEMRNATWPFLYAAEYELSYGRGIDHAKQWLKLVRETDYSFFAIDFRQVRLRIQAEVLWAEGSVYEARECVQQSSRLVERRIDYASAESEREKLRVLSAQPYALAGRTDPQRVHGTDFRYRSFFVPTLKTLLGFALLCVLFSTGRPAGANANSNDLSSPAPQQIISENR